MHTPRNSRLVAALVLLWFVAFLGSAIASTVAHPDSLQVVCSATGGMKFVDIGDDGQPKVSGSADCPLCISVMTPPPPPHAALFDTRSPLAYALQAIPAAHIAFVTAPPLPSRGPPSFLQ